MASPDLSSAITVLFIIGMIWLRTRMQYLAGRRRGRRLQLELTGWVYFASAVALLAIGWFAAPILGSAFWPASGGSSPALTRVIWFLLTYYVFILVHRYLRARGLNVFRVLEDPSSSAGLP
jgi:O-antigen/teichoic acid export membrane protein